MTIPPAPGVPPTTPGTPGTPGTRPGGNPPAIIGAPPAPNKPAPKKITYLLIFLIIR